VSDVNGLGCHAPRWSPDGRKLIFGANSDAAGRNIFIANANGSELFQVTHDGQDDDPHWGNHACPGARPASGLRSPAVDSLDCPGLRVPSAQIDGDRRRRSIPSPGPSSAVLCVSGLRVAWVALCDLDFSHRASGLDPGVRKFTPRLCLTAQRDRSRVDMSIGVHIHADQDGRFGGRHARLHAE
jgi:hypothetical protein